MLGQKQDIAKWPKATSLSFSEELLYPMFWPSLLCPWVTLSKREATTKVRSTGGLCPTTCTAKQHAKPLDIEVPQDPQNQHHTRAREDLGVLELPPLPNFGSEGGEVPSELNLNPPGWSDPPSSCHKRSSDLALWHLEKPPVPKALYFPSCPSQPLAIAGT